MACVFFFRGVGTAAGYAIVWQLPFGTCLGQASPGATSPLLGRSPDCSCRPLHGGSQRFTLRPETRRRPAGGVCESCGGGGWGAPGEMHLQATGTWWAQARVAAPTTQNDLYPRVSSAQRRGPGVKGSGCPWTRREGRASGLCLPSGRGGSSCLPLTIRLSFFLFFKLSNVLFNPIYPNYYHFSPSLCGVLMRYFTSFFFHSTSLKPGVPPTCKARLTSGCIFSGQCGVWF